MIFQLRVDMFLMQNNEKTTSDFIMCVCIYSKYIHLQNKSKTNDFRYQISRLFFLLKIYLRRQNYPEQLINKAIKNATNIPIVELRNVRRRDNNWLENISFVVTYNPRNHNILNTAKRYFPILEQSENMKEILDYSKIINSRRQALKSY